MAHGSYLEPFDDPCFDWKSDLVALEDKQIPGSNESYVPVKYKRNLTRPISTKRWFSKGIPRNIQVKSRLVKYYSI